MKRFLLFALCAMLSLNAEARTIYVNASRPNNNGSGLSAKKAKKTLQAAINVAKKGDTILVLPGTYAPIKTNNKKIAIKSTKGQKKTAISVQSKTSLAALAQLGKTYSYQTSYFNDYSGKLHRCSSAPLSKGTSTTLAGFRLDGCGKPVTAFLGVSGGNVRSCTIQGIKGGDYVGVKGKLVPPGASMLASGSKLTSCTIRGNEIDCGRYGLWLFEKTSFSRCKILENAGSAYLDTGCASFGYDCRAANCLVAGNRTLTGWIGAFYSSTLVNCTVADNLSLAQKDSSGRWIGTAGPTFSNSAKWYNCILRNNMGRVDVVYEGEWVEVCGGDGDCTDGHWTEGRTQEGSPELHNVDPFNTYKNTDKTNRDPKFSSAYRLRKGSYCIDAGKLTSAQKKQVGTKDLAGRKRIRGKAIDRGCYEY